MKIKIIYFIFIIPIFLLSATIKKIVIIGNNKVSDKIILNTINHHIGDTLNLNLSIEDRLMLNNLNLFNSVFIAPKDSIYYIIVKEKSNISATPLIDKDKVLGWSYGLKMDIDNIKDKSQTVSLSIMGGKIENYNLQYSHYNIDSNNNSLLTNFFKSSYTGVESDYILNQYGMSASYTLNHIMQKNDRLNFDFYLQYNVIDKINTGTEENFYEFISSLSFKKENYFTKDQHKNILDVYYGLTLYNDIYSSHNTINIKNRYYFPIMTKTNSPTLVFKNQMILNFTNTLPLYKKIYIGNEDFVRGYEPNPSNNPQEVQDKLKWNNILLSSIQLEIPLFGNNFIDTELLFFADYGIGSNNYRSISTKNKIRGFGFGVRYEMLNFGGADFCFGLNPYNGEKTFHLIANFSQF